MRFAGKRRHLLTGLGLAMILGTAALGCGRPPAAPTLPTEPEVPDTPAPPDPAPAPILGVERILAYGDSLTEGESTGLGVRLHDPATAGVPTSYPFKLQELVDARFTAQDVRVFNGGRGGERATEALDRMVDLIEALEPQVMILTTGTNDLNVGFDFDVVIGAIEELIDEAQARGVIVMLATLPRQVEGGRKADAFHLIEPFNAELADVAADEGVDLIDIHPHVTEALITPDGIHITEAGNEVVAGLVLDALIARFEQAAAPFRVAVGLRAPGG